MLMSAQTQPAGRISQLLPTVKCSSCNQPVPLAELGDHVCAPAPPLPTVTIPKTVPNLPKPALSPGAAASLLPQRLQGLVNNGAGPRPAPPATSRTSSPAPSPTAPRIERPRLNTNAPPSIGSSYPTRSSPLARTGDRPPIVRSTSRDPYSSGPDSPVRNRPPMGSFGRARSGSTVSSPASASPITARPSFSSVRDMPRETPPPVFHVDERSVNTQSGGEAGMAGVGRRGFAAAARAAMFTTSASAPMAAPIRASPPQSIDIGAANIGGKTSTTPPLSTSTGSSNSPGIAPYPESPVSPDPFSRQRSRSPPSSRTPAANLKSSTSVSSRGSSKPSKYSNSISQGSGSEYGLAYADSTDYEEDDDDDEDLRRVNEIRTGLGSLRTKSPPPPLPLSDSASYKSSSVRYNSGKAPSRDRSADGRAPLRQSKSKASLSSESEKSDYGESSMKRSNSSRIAQAFGLSQTAPSSYERRGGPGKPSSRSGHSRENSSESDHSAYSSRSAVLTGGATATASGDGGRSGKGRLERQMDRMAEDAERPGLSKSKSTGRGNDLRVEMDDARSRRSPSPDVRTARNDGSRRDRVVRKTKVCVRCEKKIDDGKWVQVDGGGVLCEKCWKNMYLPKCRRCNLPIEKQAVSSSDGQLKGKYHRECFNCHVCHEPFPDKTFYVLDSKPLCAYHYHEANDSLCAAALCGQPIEGPCAVSHAGDRYHPEHMVCEYPGGCKERLEEYWEVDGRMLCERHSRRSREEEEEADQGGWKPSSRAMKRTTRYIDLAKR